MQFVPAINMKPRQGRTVGMGALPVPLNVDCQLDATIHVDPLLFQIDSTWSKYPFKALKIWHKCQFGKIVLSLTFGAKMDRRVQNWVPKAMRESRN